MKVMILRHTWPRKMVILSSESITFSEQAAKILSCKMLHKMIPNQCSIMVVELADLCALVGVFNWSWYLLNRLIDYAMQTQHKDTYKFHYS